MYTFSIDGVILPITPSKITTSIKNQNKTINLINEGEINILKLPGLTEYSFDFVAPAYKYPFVIEFKEQNYYHSLLEKLKVERKPFSFVIKRELPNGKITFDTNVLVSLENYDILEDAQDGFDVTFKVYLKTYKNYGTQTLDIKTNADGTKTATKTTPRDTTKTPAKTYKVKSGDTLWNIAKKQLGDGSKYTTLAKLNNISDPNKLNVGQVLKLS